MFQFLSILIAFSLLIYTNWTILNLTMLFNWVFVHCMRNHHWSFLGFQRSRIGASLFWNNWDMRPTPLNSAHLNDQESLVALNLWATIFYSLFSYALFSGGLKPPLSNCFFSGQKRTSGEDDDLSPSDRVVQNLARFLWSIALALGFLYINCHLLSLQSNNAAQLVECHAGKLWDLGSIPRSPMLFQCFSC